MLKFRDCKVCEESHAVRADGRMSIHQDARGNRCEEPEPTRVSSEPRRVREPRTRLTPEQHAARREMKHEWDAEREAAFAVARSAKLPEKKRERFDRSIYAVGGAHVVHGGLPTLGRGR